MFIGIWRREEDNSLMCSGVKIIGGTQCKKTRKGMYTLIFRQKRERLDRKQTN